MLEDGLRIGRILDPRSGRPVVRRASVTVWHPDALAAAALSTALQVMGPEEGLEWASERGISAYFLQVDDSQASGISAVATGASMPSRPACARRTAAPRLAPDTPASPQNDDALKRKDGDRPDRVAGLIESRIQNRMRSRSYDIDL